MIVRNDSVNTKLSPRLVWPLSYGISNEQIWKQLTSLGDQYHSVLMEIRLLIPNQNGVFKASNLNSDGNFDQKL